MDSAVLARVCDAIRTASVRHRVYGNGLMTVHVFMQIFGFDNPRVSYEACYLNIGDSSVRHFRTVIDGEPCDPTIFPASVTDVTTTLEPQHGVVIDFTETLSPHFREALFERTLASKSTAVYWTLCRDATYKVLEDVLRDVELQGQLPFTTAKRKVPARSHPCPCGSGKKYNACHANLWF